MKPFGDSGGEVYRGDGRRHAGVGQCFRGNDQVMVEKVTDAFAALVNAIMATTKQYSDRSSERQSAEICSKKNLRPRALDFDKRDTMTVGVCGRKLCPILPEKTCCKEPTVTALRMLLQRELHWIVEFNQIANMYLNLKLTNSHIFNFTYWIGMDWCFSYLSNKPRFLNLKNKI